MLKPCSAAWSSACHDRTLCMTTSANVFLYKCTSDASYKALTGNALVESLPSYSNLKYVLIIQYNFIDKALIRYRHPLTFLII